MLWPRSNIIKLFTNVIYEFSRARVFVRIGWKKLTRDKHSSLIRKFVNYGQEKFYNIGPRGSSLPLEFSPVCYTSALPANIRLKTDIDKHSSLLKYGVKNGNKKFIGSDSGEMSKVIVPLRPVNQPIDFLYLEFFVK